MFKNSSRYIHLKEGSQDPGRDTGIGFFPEYRVAELSGCKKRWVWKRPRGILLQDGGAGSRRPVIDLAWILRAALYGISTLLVMFGLGRLIGGQSAAGE